MSFPVLEERSPSMKVRSYVVLQITANNREKNKQWMEGLHEGDIRGHRIFMRKFFPDAYLTRREVGWEDNFGPGPSHTWETTQDPTRGKRFTSKAEALAFWAKCPIADVVVQATLVSVTTRGL